MTNFYLTFTFDSAGDDGKLEVYHAEKNVEREIYVDVNRSWREATSEVVFEIIFVFSMIIGGLGFVLVVRFIWKRVIEKRRRLYDGSNNFENRVLRELGLDEKSNGRGDDDDSDIEDEDEGPEERIEIRRDEEDY